MEQVSCSTFFSSSPTPLTNPLLYDVVDNSMPTSSVFRRIFDNT